jgi:hypothetical protein
LPRPDQKQGDFHTPDLITNSAARFPFGTFSPPILSNLGSFIQNTTAILLRWPLSPNGAQ